MCDLEFQKFVEGIKTFEDTFWLGEYIYFRALDELQDIRRDISKLEVRHVKEIIKVFLFVWGQMGRTISRVNDSEWEQLAKALRDKSALFQKLHNESLLTVNLEASQVKEAIKEIYNAIKVKFIGPTAVSKILHLLNPELFVMWDEAIRRKIYNVSGTAEGYLNFLREVKRKVEEMISNETRRTGRSKEEIIEKICSELPSEKLGEKYTRKTLAKLIDEYNMWLAHQKSKEENIESAF